MNFTAAITVTVLFAVVGITSSAHVQHVFTQDLNKQVKGNLKKLQAASQLALTQVNKLPPVDESFRSLIDLACNLCALGHGANFVAGHLNIPFPANAFLQQLHHDVCWICKYGGLMLASHDFYNKYVHPFFDNDGDSDGGSVPLKLTDVQSFKNLLTLLKNN